MQNNLQQLALSDLFADGTAYFATGLELGRYIYSACKNWDNYEPDNKVAADNEKNDKEEMEGLLDNLYALYDVYD